MGDEPLIAVRFALYADLMLLFGLSLFARGGAGVAATIPLRRIAFVAAVAGAALSIAGVIALAASMSGVVIGAVDRASVEALMDTAPGHAAEVRIATLVLVGVAALAMGRWPKGARPSLCVASALALASLAWTGHGAMNEGAAGWIHLAADILHLLAAGVWLGAIAGLAFLLFRPVRRWTDAHLRLSHSALGGFARTGTIAVGALVVSGTINAWIMIGPAHVTALAGTAYGRLLIAKLVLFGMMLVLAALNRFRLTPALGRAGIDARAAPIASLRRSVALEAALAIAILALVAWLGMLDPTGAA